MYLNYRTVFAYGKKINLIIGGRGVGKTYGAKKFVLSKCIPTPSKFVWLRTTKAMTDVLKGDKGQALFKDIIEQEESFHNLKYVINGDGTIEIDAEPENKVIGYLMSCSEYYKYKGNSFSDVKYIVFDEFIPENGEILRGNRVIQFLNTIETICRNREDVTIILLANATNLGDEILELFFTNVKNGEYGFYINERKDALLYYMKSSDEYLSVKRNSPVGRIIAGTPYEDTIINNKFRTFDSDYFDNMPSNSNVVFSIKIDDSIIGFYQSTNYPFYFAKIVYLPFSPCFVKTMNDKVDDTIVADIVFKNNLKELAHNNIIKYHNESVRSKVVNFLN